MVKKKKKPEHETVLSSTCAKELNQYLSVTFNNFATVLLLVPTCTQVQNVSTLNSSATLHVTLNPKGQTMPQCDIRKDK